MWANLRLVRLANTSLNELSLCTAFSPPFRELYRIPTHNRTDEMDRLNNLRRRKSYAWFSVGDMLTCSRQDPGKVYECDQPVRFELQVS